MLKVPLAVELTAVIIAALSGALHAVNKKVDVVGTFALAMATGAGGGMLRDILIGVSPPTALERPLYLPVVAGAALLAMLFASSLARIRAALAPVDALLLGMWAVIGTEKALAHDLPVLSSIFVGTITAVGGGAVRDLLTGETPAVFLPGELHAIAAFSGAAMYPLCSRAAGLPTWIAEIATVATACLVRLLAVRWHVRAPAPVNLPDRWHRLHGRGRA